MSGEFPRALGPARCTERAWDSWVSELGHTSPREDGGPAFRSPPGPDKSARRAHRSARQRRKGVNRLRHDTMSLHGLFPQMDDLNAAVCHMCGSSVKCSAAYRHLVESHAAGIEPILPPPPPSIKLKSSHNRSRHKKDSIPPPSAVDVLPVSVESLPALPILVGNGNSISRSALPIPPPEPQFAEEAGVPAPGEVQVCVESGELPVVSIQDTDDLALGDNITDDIFAIMNSEGIQSADDITDVTDWKNIIRDIGSMQDINFSNTDTAPDPVVDSSLASFALTDADLSSLRFTGSSPLRPEALDNNIINSKSPKTIVTVPPPVVTPKSHSRSKTSKAKHGNKEYDPNRHCGVVTADNPKPCTRSLTCKAHALSMRRGVEGRAKPFDTLLAEHRAARDTASVPVAIPPTPAPVHVPAALLVNSLDLSAFSALAADRRVDDIYASLLSEAETIVPESVEVKTPVPPATESPPDVCWYASVPRPLALCTFSTSHAGSAVSLCRRGAGIRAGVKASCGRSARGQGAGGRSRSRARPEARRLVLWRRPALNGHVRPSPQHRHKLLDLGFSLDPLLADDKC